MYLFFLPLNVWGFVVPHINVQLYIKSSHRTPLSTFFICPLFSLKMCSVGIYNQYWPVKTFQSVLVQFVKYADYKAD